MNSPFGRPSKAPFLLGPGVTTQLTRFLCCSTAYARQKPLKTRFLDSSPRVDFSAQFGRGAFDSVCAGLN